MDPRHAAKGTVAAEEEQEQEEGEGGGGAIVGICMNRSRLFGREMSGGNGPTPNRRIIRNPCTGRNRVTVCHFRFCSLQRATMPAKRIIFVIPSLSSVLFSSPPLPPPLISPISFQIPFATANSFFDHRANQCNLYRYFYPSMKMTTYI